MATYGPQYKTAGWLDVGTHTHLLRMARYTHPTCTLEWLVMGLLA